MNKKTIVSDSSCPIFGEKHRTVVELGYGIKIKVNPRNWILYLPSRIVWYYPHLEYLLDDLHTYLIKIHALEHQEKDLNSLRIALEEASEDIRAFRQALVSPKQNDHTRLDTKETGCSGDKA